MLSVALLAPLLFDVFIKLLFLDYKVMANILINSKNKIFTGYTPFGGAA